jgi:hypothetical protein
MGYALGQLPRVYEHQCAAVIANMSREAIVNLAPLLAGADRLQFTGRHVDVQIELALMAGVDD